MAVDAIDPLPTKEDARKRKKIRPFAEKESEEVTGEGGGSDGDSPASLSGGGRSGGGGKIPDPFSVRWVRPDKRTENQTCLIDFGQRTFIFKINIFLSK